MQPKKKFWLLITSAVLLLSVYVFYSYWASNDPNATATSSETLSENLANDLRQEDPASPSNTFDELEVSQAQANRPKSEEPEDYSEDTDSEITSEAI